MEKEIVMGILKAKELAQYISEYYKEHTGKDISPVRLQKTLYFCFAYWGGFILKGKRYQGETTEIDVSKYSEYLFNENIEAWVYGPVVKDVYHEKNLLQYHNDNLFKGDTFLQDFVNNVIDDTLELNDFRLVDISHCDKSWKDNFDYEEMFHNNVISPKSIVEEYAKK